MRTVLFHRKYRRFHGGHLKVWHYFNHALATPGYDACVLFDEGTSWDRSNPWSESLDRVVDSVDAVTPDLLFVAGRDWQRMEALGLLERGLPIINLIQHMRHARETSIQNQYLERKAIRICVSDEVARAVSEAGSQGPVVVIPNGVDIPAASAKDEGERSTDIFIAGLKQPGMARRLEDRLRANGRTIEVATDHVDRAEFLESMRRAKVTLFLPNEEEGFYLPALEGMALGTIVVCPDCVGNRSYCLPDHNAFRPAYDFESLVDAVEAALAMSAEDAEAMRRKAAVTAQAHSPEAERAAFVAVLKKLDSLWSGD